MRGLALLGAAASLVLAACGGSAQGPALDAPIHFTAAGSTLAEPFLTKGFYQYSIQHPGVTVDYAAVGSGAGIEALRRGLVDFAASDAPLNDAELSAMGGADAVLQIPDIVGAVAVAFRLDSVTRLQLDGPAIADLYLGTITRWNDPRLKALNPTAILPDLPVRIVHRSDSSGTSYLFTDYLSRVSPAWSARLGARKSPAWPAGIGANGSEGMVRTLTEADGSIGYVDLTYLHGSAVAAAFVKNRSGAYVNPSIAGAAAAATAASPGVSPRNPSIADQEGPDVYPIAGLSWLLAVRAGTGPKAQQRDRLFRWLVNEGQAGASSLDYAPLPPSLRMSH